MTTNKALQSHPDALTHKQLGMLVALASMGMLFGTLLLSYMLAKARTPVWPPIGVDPVDPLIPSISTGVILASSLIIHSAVLKLREGEFASFVKRWRLGAVLGFVFLLLQVQVLYALYQAGVKIDSHLFGSILYTLIGVHGLHIVAGLASLLLVLKRATRYSVKNFEGPQLSGWFWHFLDVIWIVMFVLMVWK